VGNRSLSRVQGAARESDSSATQHERPERERERRRLGAHPLAVEDVASTAPVASSACTATYGPGDGAEIVV
jgi:hypothetical protein